ncbi:MAG: leucine-rich repeat protein [Spirochaetes bacterium]|nr:leucine-rich repeat protein [Spirochaetota bacterium]
MKDSIESIYRELKRRITHARLKEISVDVISKYRAGDHDGLAFYAAFLDSDDSAGAGKLFARVIQRYHPDKLNAILNEIELHYRAGNVEELAGMRNTFLFEMPARRISYPDMPPAGETYAYSDMDFGYAERAARDDEMQAEESFDEYDGSAVDEEYGFIEAVNRLFFGNLDMAISMDDLHDLEGELDLSDYDIVDLKGIEHCINLHTLNLSGNNIRKIEPLASLTRLESLFLSGNAIRNIGCLAALTDLRELDLSFNEIEEISVLQKLDSLQYVNLLGNPITDSGTIRELTEKGVLVISE